MLRLVCADAINIVPQFIMWKRIDRPMRLLLKYLFTYIITATVWNCASPKKDMSNSTENLSFLWVVCEKIIQNAHKKTYFLLNFTDDFFCFVYSGGSLTRKSWPDRLKSSDWLGDAAWLSGHFSRQTQGKNLIHAIIIMGQRSLNITQCIDAVLWVLI